MTQLLDIRPMRPGDDQHLSDIRQRSVLAVSDRFYDRTARENWAAEDFPGSHLAMLERGVQVLVATASEDATPLGLAAYLVKEAVGTLVRLYVDPNAQGQGIGGALLAEAEAGMARAAARRIELESSLSALAFYEKRGYLITARIRHHYQDGTPFDVRMMEKTL